MKHLIIIALALVASVSAGADIVEDLPQQEPQHVESIVDAEEVVVAANFGVQPKTPHKTEIKAITASGDKITVKIEAVSVPHLLKLDAELKRFLRGVE